MTSTGLLVEGLSVSRAFAQTTTTVSRSTSQSCGSRGSSLCVVSPPIQPFLDLLPTPRDGTWRIQTPTDRKSTRLNSSHLVISYAVFCLKKKKNKIRKSCKL